MSDWAVNTTYWIATGFAGLVCLEGAISGIAANPMLARMPESGLGDLTWPLAALTILAGHQFGWPWARMSSHRRLKTASAPSSRLMAQPWLDTTSNGLAR
ncbi:hypothetical protein ACP2AV_11420 [Aliiroseovarius sp. PTFE2010]|uniref:hypothetical protein n=1 Tax=Aliiroseovarius sp. PTFE2010 TaxID=3417190 RepID=UPI003CE9DEE3